MKPYKCAITYGTFDLFHIGHLRLLERISNMAEKVIVAVSSDEFNALKGKKCAISYENRRDIIAALRVVDKVIKEECWEQKVDDIRREKCDVFVMGDDWKGKFDFLKTECDVLYLPRTQGVSSSEIKESLRG